MGESRSLSVVDLTRDAAWFRYDAQDGLYDVAWSEIHENQLVTASGDGSIKMWDIMLNVCVLVFGLVGGFLCAEDGSKGI